MYAPFWWGGEQAIFRFKGARNSLVLCRVHNGKRWNMFKWAHENGAEADCFALHKLHLEQEILPFALNMSLDVIL